jgi:hypothetical protein
MSKILLLEIFGYKTECELPANRAALQISGMALPAEIAGRC